MERRALSQHTGSLSVTDPFLIFYVEKRNGILSKNRREKFEKSYVPLQGAREGQKYKIKILRTLTWG